MRNPALRLYPDELIVDSFAGGGGASLGIFQATGRHPDIAINHDAEALSMHAVNHPTTRHYCEDVWNVDPMQATQGKPVGLMWLSPDCKHFSKAKGGKPVSKKIRGLAWVAIRWAREVHPRVIVLENVEEFRDWGPVLDDGKPCPVRRGFTFRRFVKQLQNCGYHVEDRELRACDYGAPTTRRRLFLIARADGMPIVWPKPTHGPGRPLPWKVAADCIQWEIPCPSIFERDKPLADNTLRRIARGLKRYVIDSPKPFIVPLTHHGERRNTEIDEPMPTITGANRGELALIAPYLAGVGGRKGQSPETPVTQPYHTITAKADTVIVAPVMTEIANTSSPRCMPADEPLRTICAEIKGGHHALIAPTLVQTGYGERDGQSPRSLDLFKPLGTVVAQGQKHALVSAFLAKHYGGHEGPGTPLDLCMDTITAQDHHALVASTITKFKGTSRDGQPMDEPLHTVQAGGFHYGEVRAFLLKYYGTDQDPRLEDPMHTLTAKDRMALVTVEGQQYAIADIGMRMLQPRELFRAQGFPDTYIIDHGEHGQPLSKTAQIRMCGNSVCPPIAAAIVAAQVGAIEEVATA